MLQTIAQEIRNKANNDTRNWILNKARNEAKADAAVSFSSHLDRLATHAAVNHLSDIEIIELLRQESEKFDHAARTYGAGGNHG